MNPYRDELGSEMTNYLASTDYALRDRTYVADVALHLANAVVAERIAHRAYMNEPTDPYNWDTPCSLAWEAADREMRAAELALKQAVEGMIA